MPATKSVVYIRNYTADDNTQRTIQGNTYVSASDASFAVPSGMEFVSWNTSRDGAGTAYAVGATVVATTVYAIWESIPDPVPYITTDTELTSIANAIRTKGGTLAQLTYPAGFVSAIEAIPTGGGSASYNVTVNLTSPTSAGYASDPCCILYESDSLFGELTQVGQISSPTGSATVTVSKPIFTATFYSNSSYLSVDAGRSMPIYGDVVPFVDSFCLSDSKQFYVSGDDTVTIVGINYDDD